MNGLHGCPWPPRVPGDRTGKAACPHLALAHGTWEDHTAAFPAVPRGSSQPVRGPAGPGIGLEVASLGVEGSPSSTPLQLCNPEQAVQASVSSSVRWGDPTPEGRGESYMRYHPS